MKANSKIFIVFSLTLAAVLLVSACSASPAATNGASVGAAASAEPIYEGPAYQASSAPVQEEPEYQATSAPVQEGPAVQATSVPANGNTAEVCPTPGNYTPPQQYDTASEEYGQYMENGFKSPSDEPLSTFSIDVDTASYSNIRRYLEDGMLPPSDAVRVEECVNYFPYDYNPPEFGYPVNVGVTISDCPWNEGRYLARVSLQAKELDWDRAPASNLVFLLDVSGSMDEPDKLPLVKYAMETLTENIDDSDRISIVVYAASTGVVLEGCSGENRAAIIDAIESLRAGGSTAGGAGIELAYDVAERYFLYGGNNRVILCTDGDFNVGISTPDELDALISEKSESGVFLSVLAFGTGNVKDNRLETLADNGNGNYAYIDTESEAEKVLVKELTSTMFAVAKDVKVQVEFNPDAVKEYRLIGYDNRMLNPEDFNNDQTDAGEMGAGSCVTAFYELILVNSPENSDNVDDLVFQDAQSEVREPAADWLYVKVRYKQPESDESKLITVMGGINDYALYPGDDFDFASAVAEFALIMKGSDYAHGANLENVIERALSSLGEDEEGYRRDFVNLARLAERLS